MLSENDFIILIEDYIKNNKTKDILEMYKKENKDRIENFSGNFDTLWIEANEDISSEGGNR